MELKGVFAKSMAGHDKGYIVKEVKGKYAFLINGTTKPISKPKKKKVKHVALHVNQERCAADTDVEIRKAIKEYKHRIQEV
jgi:hypothetical protein